MNFLGNLKAGLYCVPLSHFLFLIILSLIAFSYNPGLLLEGNDGPTNVSIAVSQNFLYGTTPHLHGNFLQGVGNISFPFNTTVQPGFWLIANGDVSVLSQAILYSWFAFLLFISVLLIGYTHGFSKRTRYIAAWLLTLIAFPYFTQRIYPLTANTPQFLNIITVFAIIDFGIKGMGVRNWLTSIGYGVIVLLGVMVGLVICPAHVLLTVPMVLASLIYSFVISNRDEFRRKLVIVVGLILFLGGIGWIEYYLGLMLNSAAVFFLPQMKHVDPSLLYVSILYHFKWEAARLGPLFYCASILATIYTAIKIPKFRPLAVTVFTMSFLGLTIGTIAMRSSTSWTAPAPVYFEMLLLPFFALFLAHVSEHIIKQKVTTPVLRYQILLPLFFTSLALLIIYFVTPRSMERSGYKLPPLSTPITEILEKEIGLHKSNLFRGRVANVLPNKGLVEQFGYYSALDSNLGNDHHTTGLWLKHIPTLNEYNQLLSPSFFFLYRSFLAAPEDQPFRSLTNFSLVNPKILRLLGVKFVLSDTSSIPEGHLRAKLDQVQNLPILHLFELKNPNTEGISAKKITISEGVKQAAQIMSEPTFDIQEAVVFHINPIPHLVSADESSILLDKRGIRVKASSSGNSLLILPLEYSHCLRVDVISGAKPELMRVNIALTGLLFTEKTDVILDNRVSIFDNPRCRFKDYREFSKLLKK